MSTVPYDRARADRRRTLATGPAQWLEKAPPALPFLALYLLALAVGVAIGLLVVYRHSPGQLEADEGEYWQLSSQLLDGTIEINPRRTLAYPLVLAGLRLVSPGFLGVQFLLTAIYAFSAPLLFRLVRKLSGSTVTGVVAGALFALWPPTDFFGTSLYSEPAALPLFLLTLGTLPLGSRAARETTPAGIRAAFVAGLALALTTQIRSMYLLFLPFAMLAIVLEERRIGVAVRRVAALLAGFALLTLPWSAYMTARFHHPILVTANGGETLSGGLGPRLIQFENDPTRTANRATWNGMGKWIPISQSGYLSADELRHLPYDRQDALLRQRTLAWAAAHPVEAARIEWCKLAYMWGVYRMADNGVGQMVFGNLAIIALLLVTLAGVAIRPRVLRGTSRLWLVPLFVSGVALISWGSWRFRQPADAALIALAVMTWLPVLAGRRSDAVGPAAFIPEK